jgi:hypothetical protein
MNNSYNATINNKLYWKYNIVNKISTDFEYLIGLNINDIILFDDGSESLEDEGRTILPKNYKVFVGNKNGELQFKPYEYDKYRIVVTTYQDMIVSIDSIG